ncbi:MAG: hypothetical protein JRI23_31425, partial [Deltaproteobacteria bacterium]|nr:hypothetical protein [Deltaproteobacteria bacterium]MBW2536721.1 hypothetical protein [Deltaproteobacteria bacterium]
VAAGEAGPSESDESSGGKSAKTNPKWVVQAIEVSTRKKNPFGGRVMLRRVPGKPTDVLTYYWGGKCRGTRVPPSRLALLTEAMDKGYSVQIPAFPIQYENSVIMCMQSIRVISE